MHPSKSNSRHLIRRACFNLPKLSTTTAAQSSSSLNPTLQPGSPTSQSVASTDTSLPTPSSSRKGILHDHLGFNSSQSKDAPSRGISPRIHRNPATSNAYNPSSIEKL